jgi:hypothetical protein
MTIPQHRKQWMVAVGIVCLIAGGAGLYATIPGNDGQMHGCYQANNGQLRVIDADAGQTCRPSELGIEWRAGTTVACPVGTVPIVNVCVEAAPRSLSAISSRKGIVPTRGAGFRLRANSLSCVKPRASRC